MTIARIAVVDDEASLRVALGRLLRLADYDVQSFASGEEFLRAFDDARADCVLLDVHMPGMTGLELQLHLLAMQPELPIIFITASDEAALELDVLNAGGRCLLRKPVTSAELLGCVAEALRGHGTDVRPSP